MKQETYGKDLLVVSNASIIKVEVAGGYQGGTEPWERTAWLRIDPAGFHETHLVGRSGDRAPLNVSQVATSLLAEFEPASLLQLLDYVVELTAVLRNMAVGDLASES